VSLYPSGAAKSRGVPQVETAGAVGGGIFGSWPGTRTRDQLPFICGPEIGNT